MAIDLRGRRFWKMSGSGNDFVFLDSLQASPGELATPAVIGALCDRRNGIGADGVVFLERHPMHDFAMNYYNRDGSLAEMCGNAALCSARLARELRIVGDGEFTFASPSGPIRARIRGGEPEIDMVPVTELQPRFVAEPGSGELRIGYARVGVPHVVVLVEDVDGVDVLTRGRELRHHSALRAGANANFVSRSHSGDEGWRMRTFERGVEDETLACGTGAVATAALLAAWGLVRDETVLQTRSGCSLIARLPGADGSPPGLRGEARIVYEGSLRELPDPV